MFTGICPTCLLTVLMFYGEALHFVIKLKMLTEFKLYISDGIALSSNSWVNLTSTLHITHAA